jgi:hypothetical protein
MILRTLCQVPNGTSESTFCYRFITNTRVEHGTLLSCVYYYITNGLGSLTTQRSEWKVIQLYFYKFHLVEFNLMKNLKNYGVILREILFIFGLYLCLLLRALILVYLKSKKAALATGEDSKQFLF